MDKRLDDEPFLRLLLDKGEKELLSLRNFGLKSKEELEQRLGEIGLSLSGEVADKSSQMEGTIDLADTEAGVEVESSVENEERENETQLQDLEW